jgi:hypothetical protein
VTPAGGTINCLDPGDYGPVTITKSLSILCNIGESYGPMARSSGIVVNAGVADSIVLEGIVLEGFGTGVHGINMIGGGSVVVRKSSILHFTGNGINLVGTAGANALIQDSIISRNGGGVNVLGAGGAANSAVIDRTTIETHPNFAVQVSGPNSVFLSASSLIGSGTKLSISGGGTVTSYGNNVIRGAGVPPTATLGLQ